MFRGTVVKLVREPWGFYYVDPWQLEEARREGERLAEETLAKIDQQLSRPRQLARSRSRRRRSPK